MADVLGLVVSGDEDRDLAAEALRQVRLAELLPGEALEHRRELARVSAGLGDRPQYEQEEDEDGEDGEAEDAAAVALLEGEGREQLVGDFGAGDDRQPEPRREQDQHVDVAQRTAADQRVGDDRHGGDQAGAAQRGQFGRKETCLGQHWAPGIGRASAYAWVPLCAAGCGRARSPSPDQTSRGGKREGQCHQHLVAAGSRQRGRADRGDDDDRSRHRGQLPPPAAPAKQAEPGQPQGDDQQLDRAPGGAAHRFADAAAPHPPDLARGHRQVAERVFAEVVGEVLLADLAEGGVARQFRVAGGDPVEERRRVTRSSAAELGARSRCR